jgi:hypothetical protein
LLELFHEIADRLFNPQLPILQNTDGEPFSPHKLVFDLTVPRHTAFDAIKHLALDELDEGLPPDATRDAEDKLTGVRFPWKKRGNKIHAAWDNTVLGWIEIDGTVSLRRSTRRRVQTQYERLSRRHSARMFVIERAKSNLRRKPLPTCRQLAV